MIPGAQPTVGQQSAWRGGDVATTVDADDDVKITEPWWCWRCGVHRVAKPMAVCPVCARPGEVA